MSCAVVRRPPVIKLVAWRWIHPRPFSVWTAPGRLLDSGENQTGSAYSTRELTCDVTSWRINECGTLSRETAASAAAPLPSAYSTWFLKFKCRSSQTPRYLTASAGGISAPLMLRPSSDSFNLLRVKWISWYFAKSYCRSWSSDQRAACGAKSWSLARLSLTDGDTTSLQVSSMKPTVGSGGWWRG